MKITATIDGRHWSWTRELVILNSVKIQVACSRSPVGSSLGLQVPGLCPTCETVSGSCQECELADMLWSWKVSLSQPSVPRRPGGRAALSSLLAQTFFYQASEMALVHFHAYMEAFLTLEPQREKVECWFLVFLFPNPNRHTYHASWLAVTGEARAAQKWLAQQEAASGWSRPAPPPPHTHPPPAASAAGGVAS